MTPGGDSPSSAHLEGERMETDDGGAGGGPAIVDVHLRSVGAACEAAIGEALRSHRSELGRVHQLDLDIAAWVVHVTTPSGAQLRAARKELGIGEYCAAAGLYRQAYESLRLFLELSFAAVHFSVNEFERRLWASDRLDFSWSGALQGDDGLLSRRFVGEFAPSLADDAGKFAGLASDCYRHCSQFVHGKAAVTQDLPERVEYAASVVSDWCLTASRAAEAVLFLLYIRYGEEFDANGTPVLQDTIIEHFGNSPAVRGLLGLSED